MSRHPSFNKKTIKQFWLVTKPFFISEERLKARSLLLLLIAFMIAVNGSNILMSFANRDFMTALAQKNTQSFFHSLLLYCATFLVAIPVAVFYRYAEERLALLWRQWLTQHLIKKYLLRRSYYRLRSSSDIDNPDQRIAEDVRNFTATTLSFLLITINSGITLFAFVGVLASISTVLVAVLILYALAGTVGTFLIGRKLVKLYFRQYRQEGNFRYGLIRVRDNAESIAFFRGEPREWIDLKSKVASVIQNTLFIIGWNRNLGFFTTSYNYVALVVPILIVAPLYLQGAVEFGVIPQAAGAFAQVLAAMSLIITQFERLSSFSAGVTRLASLSETLNAYELTDEDDDPQVSVDEGRSRLKLDKLTVATPGNEKILIKELSLILKKGDGILIMGESGTGKSSLLRTIAGLWNTGDGSISRPQFREMMFLPQKPYMVLGSLSAQIQYPSRERDVKDKREELTEILKRVNLDKILDRVDGSLTRKLDWVNILSLGEQQRLSFARLVFKKPKLAFLDESTSALDENNEGRLYQILREMKISYISVGHRSSLINYHDYVLRISQDGSWKIEKNENVIKNAPAAA